MASTEGDEALAVACPKCKAIPGEPCVTGGYLPVGDLPGDETAYGPHRHRLRAARLSTAPPEGLDEGLREALETHRPDGGADGPGAMCVTCTEGFGTPDEWPVSYPCPPLGRALLAVLPLLTAERERADALQRQVDEVRALCDKAEQQQPGRLPAVDVRDLSAALSRPATEGGKL